MNVKNFLIVSLSMLMLNLSSQELYNEEEPANFSLTSIEASDDGGVEVNVIKQRLAYTLNQTGMLVSGATNELINEYCTYSFDQEGSFKGQESVFYTNSGGDKNVGDITNHVSYSSISLVEMKTKYPELFKSDDYKVYKVNTVDVGTYTMNFDPYGLGYVGKENSKNFQPRHPNYEQNKKMYFFNHIYIINEELGNVTAFFGIKDLVDKENKYNYMKDLDFVTYNFDNQIINQFNVKFEYRRNLIYSSNVISEEDPTKSIGKLFVFAKAGKKDGPDPSMFDVVYCSNTGELIFQLATKLGTIDKNRINIDMAFGTEDRVNLLVNSRIEDVLKVGIITLDKSGTTDNLSTQAEMKAMTKNIPYNKSVGAAGNRSVLGTFASEPAYKFGFSEKYIVNGLKKLENGDYSIWGQMEYEIADPNAPAGTSTVTGPKVKRYAEFVCFQFGNDLKIKKVYVNDLPPAAVQASIKMISEKDRQLYFLLPVATNKAARTLKSQQKLMSQAMKPVTEYPASNLYAPELLKINLTDLDASAVTLSGKSMINPVEGYKYNSASNTLFIPCVVYQADNKPTLLEVGVFKL